MGAIYSEAEFGKLIVEGLLLYLEVVTLSCYCISQKPRADSNFELFCPLKGSAVLKADVKSLVRLETGLLN